MKKRPITIQTSSASKVYDNEELILNDYEITSGSLVLDHEVHIGSNTAIHNAGETLNILGLMIYEENVEKNE